jgi:hypothetical protein
LEELKFIFFASRHIALRISSCQRLIISRLTLEGMFFIHLTESSFGLY